MIGQKGSKLARFDLLPTDALWIIAEQFGIGAEKYAERNWEEGYNWSLSYAALQRHLTAFWGGEDMDPDSEGRSYHLGAAGFHIMAMLHYLLDGGYGEYDDRPGRTLDTPSARVCGHISPTGIASCHGEPGHLGPHWGPSTPMVLPWPYRISGRLGTSL